MSLDKLLSDFKAREASSHAAPGHNYFRKIAYAALTVGLCTLIACCGGKGGGGDDDDPPTPTVYQCNNGKDDDGDGYIDMADLGCSSPTDNNEADDPLPGLDATLDSPQKYDAIVGHAVDFEGTGHSDGENIVASRIDYENDGTWDATATHNSQDITDTFQHSGYGSAATWTAKYQIEISDGRTANATLNVAVSPNGVPYVTGLDTNGDGIPDVVDADYNGVLDQVIGVSANPPPPWNTQGLDYWVICQDSNGDPLTYNAPNAMPTNFSLDIGTGRINANPDPSQVGITYTPSVVCTDGIDTSEGLIIQFQITP